MSILKELLAKLGLLKITISVYTHVCVDNVILDFINSLKSYCFNNLLTYFPIYFVRRAYLKYILKIKIGKKSFIHIGCRFGGPIIIGDNTVVGRNCVFLGNVIIKNNVSITAETYVFTSSHLANSPTFECFYKSVVIEDYAWIGARAMILPGVQIGRGAILGANSTATKNIPEYSIYAGIPAKKIGVRQKNLEYILNYSPFFQ